MRAITILELAHVPLPIRLAPLARVVRAIDSTGNPHYCSRSGRSRASCPGMGTRYALLPGSLDLIVSCQKTASLADEAPEGALRYELGAPL
jgi:hypothetical protein